jgi:hypothetical protein
LGGHLEDDSEALLVRVRVRVGDRDSLTEGEGDTAETEGVTDGVADAVREAD